MRRWPWIFAVIGILGLTSWVSEPDLISRRLASMPLEQHAYMVGTFVVNCELLNKVCRQSFNVISTDFHSDEDKKAQRDLRSTQDSMFGDTVYDFMDLDRKEKGYHFCIPLAPGNYSFYTL
jgi:hypothetical protein